MLGTFYNYGYRHITTVFKYWVLVHSQFQPLSGSFPSKSDDMNESTICITVKVVVAFFIGPVYKEQQAIYFSGSFQT